MKKIIATGFTSLLLMGTISSALAQDLYEDDLYGSPKKNTKVSTTSAISSTKSSYNRNTVSSSENLGEVVESYDEALKRRVEAYQSDKSYPQAYWDIQEKYVGQLSRKYDQNLYNIIVINDRVWVEPSYITSLFDDSDPTTGINNYVKGFKDGFSASNNNNNVKIIVNVTNPWYSSWNNYGWNDYYTPYYYPYYRPYYSPYWGGGYNPYWGGGYYPHYRPYHNPYWGGGGYYRPYNGSSRSNGYYTGSRNQNYERGSGFGRRDNSAYTRQSATSNEYDRNNVRVYNSNRRSNSSSNTVDGRPTQRPTQSGNSNGSSYNNRVERSRDNFRRIDPSRTNQNRVETTTEYRRQTIQRTEPTTRPSYTPPPTTSRPSYTPPAGRQNSGGGGGNYGGGGGGGRRR